MKSLRTALLLSAVGAGLIFGVSSFTRPDSDCKIDDIISKYKKDTRCNSVSISKAMLDIIIKQRKLTEVEQSLKGINTVNIISVKLPGNRMDFSINFGTDGEGLDFDSNTATMTMRVEKDKQVIEKSIREKKEQKELEQKKKAEELKSLGEALVREAAGCLSSSAYIEMMTVNDNGKNVKYYAKQEGELIKEFVVITVGKYEYSVILVKGSDIKISSLGRLGSVLPSADIDIDL